MPIYLTHDNRGRPFEVRVGTKTVTVSRTTDTVAGDTMVEEKPWSKTFTTSQTFVGRSKLNKMTSWSGGAGPYFDGNSFLLCTGELEYVFVGHEIFSFKSLDPIVKYCSPVGNNDVPYPWAVDRAGNVYLMLDKVVMLASAERDAACKAPNDPYTCYYYDQRKWSDAPFEWFLGEEEQPHEMSYTAFPQKRHAGLVDGNPWSSMSIKYPNEGKRLLEEEEYCKLMKELGEAKRFQPMEEVEMIHARPGWH